MTTRLEISLQVLFATQKSMMYVGPKPLNFLQSELKMGIRESLKIKLKKWVRNR